MLYLYGPYDFCDFDIPRWQAPRELPYHIAFLVCIDGVSDAKIHFHLAVEKLHVGHQLPVFYETFRINPTTCLGAFHQLASTCQKFSLHAMLIQHYPISVLISALRP